MRGVIGRLSSHDADPASAELLSARVRAARAIRGWTELDEDDLVRRERWWVHAETDELFSEYRGPVFATASISIIPTMAPLWYAVGEDGLMFYEKTASGPRTWSEVVRRRTLRGAA